MVNQVTKSVVVANPAAATDFSTNVPGGVTWELQAVRYRLVTSATVNNRLGQLQILDEAGNVLAAMTENNSQAASLTWDHTFTKTWRSVPVNISTFVTGTIPMETPLKPGWTIKSNVQLLSAGDQLSAIMLTVIEKPIVPGWGQ